MNDQYLALRDGSRPSGPHARRLGKLIGRRSEASGRCNG